MNWSNLRHFIGDTHDGQECESVYVILPDGRLAVATGFCATADGKLCLTTDWPEQASEGTTP